MKFLCCTVCSASTDTKWYSWIEERFNISVAEDRKITFEQFKKALHLDKVSRCLLRKTTKNAPVLLKILEILEISCTYNQSSKYLEVQYPRTQINTNFAS